MKCRENQKHFFNPHATGGWELLLGVNIVKIDTFLTPGNARFYSLASRASDLKNLLAVFFQTKFCCCVHHGSH